jgi:hypothetical protein
MRNGACPHTRMTIDHGLIEGRAASFGQPVTAIGDNQSLDIRAAFPKLVDLQLPHPPWQPPRIDSARMRSLVAASGLLRSTISLSE